MTLALFTETKSALQSTFLHGQIETELEKSVSFGNTSQMPPHQLVIQKFFPNNSSRFWKRRALAQQSRSKDLDFSDGCKSRLVVLNKQNLVPSQLNRSTIIGCRLGWCG